MAEIVINNFTRGQLDHDLNGRFDLPFYMNGFEVCRNFYSNYKGNIKFRPGFEFISKTKDNSRAALYEFRFNTEQAYLLEFANGKIRFYTYDANGNFGYVLDNNQQILEINSGITDAQAQKLSLAQNADVMYIAMNEITPKKLTRTSANSFTLTTVSPTDLNFTTDGYPSSVCFYSGRLWYGGFSKNPLKVVASKSADYDVFTIPTQDIKDDDALALTLAEITDPIEWIKGGRQNLYIGNAEGVSVVNGGSYDTPITSTAVNAALGNHEGASPCTPIIKDNQFYYVSVDKRKVYMFDFDLLTEKFIATDLNWIAQDITRGNLKKIVYKRDNNYNIYGLTEDHRLVVLLYNQAESILGWFEIKTDGYVFDIATVTRPDGKDDLFLCVHRFSDNLSENTNNYVERLADEVEFTSFYETKYFMSDTNKGFYNRLIAEELKKCRYLDNCQNFASLQTDAITISTVSGVKRLTNNAGNNFNSQWVGHNVVIKTKTGKEYGVFKIDAVNGTYCEVTILSDGYRFDGDNESATQYTGGWYVSFNRISNLNDFNNKTVSVVADGGYLGDYQVTNNVLQFDREITSCTIGIPYRGLLKTFNIGDYMSGKNYQTAPKRIAKVIMRFVYSAGVEVGTALDTLKEVQYFAPTGFFDLPPLPMDGDERRSVPDTMADWKVLFVMQNKPLPVNLTMIQYNTEFGG